MDKQRYVVLGYVGKVFILCLLAAGMMAPAHAVLKAKWRTSTSTSPWASEQQLSIVAHTTQTTEIILDTTVKYQTMTGWGGSPNESGVLALHKLSATLQDSVIKAMYDTVTGCKFNMIRLPIGCSDFSESGYSLDDNAADYTMSKISINRDSLVTLDFCKKALAINPALKVWGSPWSAPNWMKNNDNWFGGSALTEECALKQDAQTLTAYALYFSKAVTLYKAYGLPFFALAFQNEPYCCQPFPSMRWSSGAMMLNFMKNYLAPRMVADHPDVELWTPTMNLNDTSFFVPMLRDAYTASIITTVCYQYQGEDVMSMIHSKFPNIREYLTELQCGGGDNSWSYIQTSTFPEIKRGVSSGVSGAFQWNLLLANGGYSAQWATGSNGHWAQNSMITIDTVGKKIVYNSQYYGLKHLSYYIRPGSKIVKVTGQYDTNEISAKNPDGSLAVVANNQNNGSQNVAIVFGTQMVTATLPALSYSSFMIYDSSATSAISQNIHPAEETRFLSVNKNYTIAGDKFSLPREFAGKTCLGALYDINGRFVREFSVKSGTVSLSKDLGVSNGVYIAHLKSVHD
jgi:glucosylceramidase